MEFTHLHVHTEYSLLDGSNKIKEYVARVKELGMDSAAITDHGYGRRLLGLRFNASLAMTSPLNLPAPGRCQALYVFFRICRALCF